MIKCNELGDTDQMIAELPALLLSESLQKRELLILHTRATFEKLRRAKAERNKKAGRPEMEESDRWE
jgi:hypothetical protein